MSRNSRRDFLTMLGAGAAALALPHAFARAAESAPLRPVIDGQPWIVAGNPDLGRYNAPKQQVVDFAIWPAADGSWQIWSCIRGTGCGGRTRLLHRWEGKRLTDADWTPKGIAMEADPRLGETPGGLQAPHVVRWQGRYVMAYGDWEHICFAESEDGKTFLRRINPDGKTGVFGEEPGSNTRDPMLLFTRGLWHCYYTAFPGRKGYDFVRTSPDLKRWSDPVTAAYGGAAGTGHVSAECPFVVELEPGLYYLFRTQRYGQNAQTTVYRSSNPFDFGIDNDSRRVCTLPVAAPEIIRHEGQYYIAYLRPDLHGIQVARLKWER